ncbi:hypothetical protein CAL29_24755 [Bordetella genomosp. 10]|uniref:Uncharacterized protein n=1 Tax=Bordetella genomosp. 10 TaxID=1416804 RepID=A0A261S1D8_9BORD|nr:hypothetical protein CAL29_24755 [Bordetella genomosp. 10]
MPRSPFPPTPDLLHAASDHLRPPAERMRPRSLDDVVGQRRQVERGMEIRLKEKLDQLRAAREQARRASE